ncbi:MAG: hypothetical protein R3185_09230, partial [Candidatus Thermoplasmatota archaeon]|nr:hypothetical protein [Candidatus Thermoplasmatota archaeon]
MRIRASLLLLTGLALLVAPAAGAEVMSEVTFTFHEADTYTFVAQVTFTGENASTYRSNADLDGDQLVSEDEEAAVRGALTDLTEDVNRSDHRLDGGLPETIEVTNMTFQNLTGPVVQGGELVFRTTATYRYAVNASSHELTVARAATGPNATFLVTLLGPPGYQLTNLTGFDLK